MMSLSSIMKKQLCRCSTQTLKSLVYRFSQLSREIRWNVQEPEEATTGHNFIWSRSAPNLTTSLTEWEMAELQERTHAISFNLSVCSCESQTQLTQIFGRSMIHNIFALTRERVT